MKVIIFALLLALVCTKLVVYHPYELRNKINRDNGEIGSSLANFGKVPYGHSIIGRVWFDEQNPDGCEDFTIKITGEGDPDTSPSPIVLVHRGGCPFVKKVRNVEHAGGALAVIIDNNDQEIVERIIMVDNGSGGGISIPSMLISTQHGQAIRKFKS